LKPIYNLNNKYNIIESILRTFKPIKSTITPSITKFSKLFFNFVELLEVFFLLKRQLFVKKASPESDIIRSDSLNKTQLEVKAKNSLISAHSALSAPFSSVFSARSAYF
jgi:hypothetical protein